MAGYRIEKRTAGLGFQLTGVGDIRDELLRAFNECAEGRCSCPTSEYEKVASMMVEEGTDQIEISLEAKPGRELDTSEIAYCLAHMIGSDPTEI